MTPEIAAEILRDIAEGIPLAEICRRPGMPTRRLVSLHRKRDAEFDAAYLEARDEGYDAIAVDCIRIADDAGDDFRMGEKSPIVDSDHISRSRLRVETRLKLLAKWDPRRYGDKLQHADANGNELPPATIVINPVTPRGE